MPRYLNTKGKATLAIGICDRCQFKYPLDELREDGNSPGLRVCVGCCDQLDTYRLPARQTENISLQYPRPDEPLS